MTIAVVGGGIGGLAAALRLSQLGLTADIYERSVDPIDKVCGEGLLPAGVQVLRKLGVSPERLGHPYHGLRFVCGSQTLEMHFFDDEPGYGIRRDLLDRVMRDCVINAQGVRLHLGARFRTDDSRPNFSIIAADGIHSTLARSSGCAVAFTSRIGVRFRMDMPALDMVEVHFFPFGEVYLTPVASHCVSVAFLLDTHETIPPGGGASERITALFYEYFPNYNGVPLSDFGTRAPVRSSVAGPWPKFPLVGDALAAFDPITGGGMTFALISAWLAAKFIHTPGVFYKEISPVVRTFHRMERALYMLKGGRLATATFLRLGSLFPVASRTILRQYAHLPRLLSLTLR